MVYSASVVYPNEEDATFDLDYYLKTHMPLVMEKWGPYGLKTWDIIQFKEGLDGASPKYSIHAMLIWESAEAVKKATTSEEAKAVFGDVPNFSNKAPVFLQGHFVGSSTDKK